MAKYKLLNKKSIDGKKLLKILGKDRILNLKNLKSHSRRVTNYKKKDILDKKNLKGLNSIN